MNLRDVGLGALAGAMLVSIYGWAGKRDYEDAQITAKIVRDVTATREVNPCEFTMKSWGPGERWHPKGEEKPAACAPAAARLPNYILTLPVTK